MVRVTDYQTTEDFMNTVRSADGTTIAFTKAGQAPLAEALPDASYRTLPGQTHMVKPQAIAPVLTEFFLTDN